MSINPPSPRPPIRPALAIGSTIIVFFMAFTQFAYGVKHPEHADLYSLMGWICLAFGTALVVAVAIVYTVWGFRRRRFAGEAAHLEP